MSSFAGWIKQKKGDNFAVKGYTPRKLMHTLKYSPYEAYCILVELIVNPRNTLQRLKYRESDPQYQRNPNVENH